MPAPMNAEIERRQSEIIPEHLKGQPVDADVDPSLDLNLNEWKRDGADDLGLGQRKADNKEPLRDTKKPLRSIFNPAQSEEREEATAMASPSIEGPRQRTTESTSMTSTMQPSKDYSSISRVPSRDAAQKLHSSNMNGAATQEDSSDSIERRAPQQRADSAKQRAEETERHESGWWLEFWEKWGSVELENKGSVARDHLALERTFLAWLRTSLSFASIGIAITQLFRLNSSLSSNNSSSSSSDTTATSTHPHAHHVHKLRHLGKPLGATFIGISILMLFIGFHRYFEAQHYVIRGKFPASRGSIVLVSAVAGGLILSSLIVILATSPTVFET